MIGITIFMVIKDIAKKKSFSRSFVTLSVLAIFFGTSAFFMSFSLMDDVKGILETDKSGVLVEGFLGDDFAVTGVHLGVSIMGLWGYILLRKRDKEKGRGGH